MILRKYKEMNYISVKNFFLLSQHKNGKIIKYRQKNQMIATTNCNINNKLVISNKNIE